MSQVKTRDDIKLDEIYRAYDAAALFWKAPTLEQIMDNYDFDVQTKLRDLHERLSPHESQSIHPWQDLKLVSSPVLDNISQLIGQKALLETNELIMMLDRYNLFYIDAFGYCNHLPTMEVW